MVRARKAVGDLHLSVVHTLICGCASEFMVTASLNRPMQKATVIQATPFQENSQACNLLFPLLSPLFARVTLPSAGKVQILRLISFESTFKYQILI